MDKSCPLPKGTSKKKKKMLVAKTDKNDTKLNIYSRVSEPHYNSTMYCHLTSKHNTFKLPCDRSVHLQGIHLKPLH